MIKKTFMIAALIAVVVSSGPAWAHEHREVGDLATTVGWVEEPAYVGFGNAAQLRIEKAAAADRDDGETDPVTEVELQVEITFGGPDDTETYGPVEMSPAFGIPGEYRAFMVPTRPGTYTFRIFGTVDGQDFDETYTSGPDTFNDIRATSDVQFPEIDPSAGELKEATERLENELSSAQDQTRIALIVGGLGLLLGIFGLFRGRRTN